MRIQAMGLCNFRSFRAGVLSGLGQVNVIGGPNGAGKSSIVDALAVALTGTCRGAEAGRGHEGLRRSGAAKRWSVTVELAPGQKAEIVRREEGEGPRSAVQTQATLAAGIPPHQIRACLYAGELLQGADKDVQQLILELASPGITLSERTRDLAERYLVAPGEASGALSLDQVEKLYQAAYKARREAGREAEAHRAAAVEIPEGIPEVIVRMTIEEIQNEAKRVDNALRLLRSERDQLLFDIGNTHRDPERLQGALEEAQKRLAAVPARAERGAAKAAEDIEALRRQLEEVEPRWNAAAEEVKKQREFVRTAQGKADELLVAIEEIKALGDKCPSCKRPLGKAQLEEVLAPLLKKADEAKAFHQSGKTSMKEAEKALEALPMPQALREKIAMIEQLASTEAQRQQDLVTAKNQVAALKAQLDDARAKASQGTQAAQAKAEAMHARIQRGEDKARLLARYLGAREAADKAKAAQGSAELRYTNLDELCQDLGPDGARAQSSLGVQDLEAAINGICTPMGFLVTLQDAARREGPVKVNGRPAQMLSTSEEVRVGIAIRAAVARWTGLGLVVIDDLDRCMGDAQAAAQGAIQAIGSDCQVLVLTAVRDVDQFCQSAPASAQRTGWGFFLVAPGQDGSEIATLAPAEREAA